jgi:WD40 repeat protein
MNLVLPILASVAAMAVATAGERAEAPWPQVKSVDWSPDSKHLVSGGYDGRIRLFEVATGKSTVVYRSQTPFINTVEWSPDAQRILAITDQTVELLDIHGKEVAVVVAKPPLQHEAFPVVNDQMRAAFSPTGERFAVAGWHDGRVMVFDARTGRVEHVFTDIGNTVSSIAWAPNGRQLAVGSWDQTVRLLDVVSRMEATRLEVAMEGGWVEVATSPDGKRLAWHGYETDVWVLDLQSKKQRRIIVEDGAQSIAWSPDGGRIAVLGSEELHLLDMEAGRGEKALAVSRVDQVLWSPDGRYVAVFGRVGVATIWNVGTGEQKTFGTAGALAFSPDMRFLGLGEAVEPFVSF